MHTILSFLGWLFPPRREDTAIADALREQTIETMARDAIPRTCASCHYFRHRVVVAESAIKAELAKEAE